MTEKRKQYLKEYRKLHREKILRYHELYNKEYRKNKKLNNLTRISITDNSALIQNGGIRIEAMTAARILGKRICSLCKTEKRIEEFPKRKDKPQGRIYRCYECHRIKCREKYKTTKEIARAKIKGKIRSGKIKREPCVVCGDVKSHAHHTDYNDPLNVVWLCRHHHDKEHKRLKENGIIIPD